MKDLKFVSSDILVSFLRPFFKVKKKTNCISFIYDVS